MTNRSELDTGGSYRTHDHSQKKYDFTDKPKRTCRKTAKFSLQKPFSVLLFDFIGQARPPPFGRNTNR
jgi:hypothetical protein